MNVRDLIDMLENYPDETEVRIAEQPAWPFEYSISDLVEPDGSPEDDDNYDHPERDNDVILPSNEDQLTPAIIYLIEGQQLGYLPGNISRQLRWK
jgi:hypothetical protein